MTNPYLHDEIPWTSQAREIADWIVTQGLRGSNELKLLEGFCERLNRCGAAIIKAHVARHTLYPIFGAPMPPSGDPTVVFLRRASSVVQSSTKTGSGVHSPT